MIRYTCPRCKTALESPEHRAGQKSACPRCRQCLLVPRPPRGNPRPTPARKGPAPARTSPRPARLAGTNEPPEPSRRGVWVQGLIASLLVGSVALVGVLLFVGASGGLGRFAGGSPPP